jgi:glycosyltransferase involved in cell wall biosynthesis
VNKPSLDQLPSPPPGRTGWPWTEGPAASQPGLPDGRSWPRISIVTASYNQGAFLEETIRSVLLQGYPDLEYLIIDGGSTDDSVEVIRRYEPWLSFWVSERDQGQSDALSKGFLRSTGDILAWLNSDDIYCRGALFSVGSYYGRHPDTGLLYGDSEIIDADGATIERLKGQEADLESLLVRNVIPQPSAFFSRQAFDKAGGITRALHFIMDYELWVRMTLQGTKLAYVPELFSRFRWYQVSKSGSYSTQFGYEYLAFVERLFQHPQDERLLKTRLKAFHYAFAMIMACNGRGAEDDDIKRALGLWTQHLEQYRDDYGKDPTLWADSLYRIGNAYCLQGEMRAGRHYLAKSLEVGKRFGNRALPGWLVSCLGNRAYGLYERFLQAVTPLARRLQS